MPEPTSRDDRGEASRQRFGTFGGVFTPSILTILGVVMYMRLGWVVGSVGLAGALGVVAVAHLISYATGLSVASIATNRTVRAGGAYYMISRSLGAAAGAAIGFPLYLGQALGVTFYIVGFTESLDALFPIPEKVVGTAVLTVITWLSIRSSALAIRAQYVVMAIIALSLAAFFTGGGPQPTTVIEWTNPEGRPFTEVFAVFFPAVTGIMAGVSMSGDLKDPRKSIPRGTLLAITAGLLVYVAIPVWMAMHATNAEMTSDTQIVWRIATVPAAIYAGVWAATLSSALGGILTAPRTLQALALDGLAPRLFTHTYGRAQEPVPGILITFVLAETGIVLGDLDAIAPILTMFFLVTYGFTNLACGLERWASSPSFRPDFKVPAAISLLGAGACFYVMSIIDMGAMAAALIVCGFIYVIAKRRALGTTYGDARHGIWQALVRTALHQLKEVEFHPQNWRPNLLILGGNPDKRAHLLRLGSAIVQDHGIVSYAHLLEGDVGACAERRRRMLREEGTQVGEDFPNVFYRADIVPDLYRGAVAVAQAHGIGNLEANCVLLGWPNRQERFEDFVAMLRDLALLDRAVLISAHRPGPRQRRRKKIDIWWGGLEGNGGLMLLIAFLLTSHDTFRNAEVRLLTVFSDEHHQQAIERSLERVLSGARLHARYEAIPSHGREIPTIMHEYSRDADMAIVGIRIPDEGESLEAFRTRMTAMLDALPATLMVHSARSFESEPVLFDS